MKIPWKGRLQKHPKFILEEAGYHEFLDPNTQKVSYIRRLASGYYPRMHVYINAYDPTGGVIDIHLDQKKASYSGQTAHSGDYDGPQVEEEKNRLVQWLAHYIVR